MTYSTTISNPLLAGIAASLRKPTITIYESRDKQYYFVLAGTNGEKQATSEMYPTYANAKRGAEDFQRNAAIAVIKN